MLGVVLAACGNEEPVEQGDGVDTNGESTQVVNYVAV